MPLSIMSSSTGSGHSVWVFDAAGLRGCDFVIRCTFDGLSADEEARFLEWCTNEKGKLRLHVCMRGSRRISPGGGSVVASQHRAGAEAEGLPLDGELREYLKATYLKPLRDAERELRAGRRSRLSRILGAMPTMGAQGKAAAHGAEQLAGAAHDQTAAHGDHTVNRAGDVGILCVGFAFVETAGRDDEFGGGDQRGAGSLAQRADWR